MTKSFLPYGCQQIEADDIEAVTAVLKSAYLTTGPATVAFETAFAEKTGSRYAVSCANGTAALHLAALALNLGPGDQVAVPAITFLATANAAHYVGAEAVFIDVEPDTALMDFEDLETQLDRHPQIKAIFPVHMAGQVAEMETIHAIAQKRGLKIVEDAAHAIGGTYKNHPVGDCAFSDITIFSLHPVKTICMGEGGMITTNDPDLYERLLQLRNHGMTWNPDHFQNSDLGFSEEGIANPWYYEMAEPGFNYRANEMQCALGHSQLRKLDRFVEARRKRLDLYDDRLKDLAPVLQPLARKDQQLPGWHLYVALIDFKATGSSRARVMARLREMGVGSQVHYIPVPWQPWYKDRHNPRDFPGAADYYDRCLSLPLFPAMTEQDIDRVADALSSIFA